jgi:Protein of unknown function (DUF4236)
MGLRFRRSIRLLPGVRLNVGLRRASLSIGPPGLAYNVRSKGSQVTVGLPGSGLSYTHATPHQNPVTLVSNAVGTMRRFSATPFVILAFIAALFYLAVHSSNDVVPPTTTANNSDVVRSTEMEPQGSWTDTPSSSVPLPRPRPSLGTESSSRPLQIIRQR